MNVFVEAHSGPAMADQALEVVERKGLGHPDTICDAVADAVSVALCREYRRRFGAVLHHNVDKCLLAAGQVTLGFGVGCVTKPMELTIGDRATFRVGDEAVPVEEIAFEAARGWFSKHLPHVVPEEHLRLRSVLAQGSAELTGIFGRGGEVLPANDTSAAVEHYPFTPAEAAVLGVERHLNSRAFKRDFPETGEDVKVMALRRGGVLDVTVAMPLLCGHVASEAEYFARKARVHQAALAFLRDRHPSFSDVTLHLNTLDAPGRGVAGVYLSLLGTSAEGADSGQVGRGNRVNGLICLNRPQGAEAAAGKNPVSHVGKIYNVLARETAREICDAVEGVSEVSVLLVSRIGAPIDEPRLAAARLVLGRGRVVGDVRGRVEAVIERRLSAIAKLCRELSEGVYEVW